MDQQELFILILVGITIMICFALAVIWFFNEAQKKIIATKLIQKEQEVVFQKELLENAVTIQENERDRIAKELHDDIGSKLNIVSLNLHLLKEKVERNEENTILVSRIEEAINASAERTRNISHELMPPVLKNFGFGYALEELQNSLNAAGEIRITINYYQNVAIKDKIKLLHIYRILQELITNTIKYGQATKVDVAFEEDGVWIDMTYKDNGLGFDKTQESTGLGFSNIKTRAELLNGKLSWDTAIGKGFILTLKFPNHD